MGRGTLWGAMLVSLALAAPSRGGGVDKPSQFVIDLSSHLDEPKGIRFKTKKHFWQLPHARVRKGYGVAMYLVEDPERNDSQARVYVEVEPLKGRFLADAVKDVSDSLADVMAPFDTQLVGKVLKGNAGNVRIVGETVTAHKLHYRIDIVTATPRTQNDAVAVVFPYGKALITITVESFEENKVDDHLEAVLSAMSFEKLPARAKRGRLKLIDAKEHIYRFITMEVPKQFVAKHKDCEYGVSATYAHRDADPELGRPGITVRRRDRPRRRGMDDFEAVVKWFHNEADSMYSDIGKLTPVKISGGPGFRYHYTDKTEKGEFKAFVVVFQVREQIWEVRMGCAPEDAKAEKEAERDFDKMVSSLVKWSGKKA